MAIKLNAETLNAETSNAETLNAETSNAETLNAETFCGQRDRCLCEKVRVEASTAMKTARLLRIGTTATSLLAVILVGWSARADDSDSETLRTQELLGIPIEEFPTSQGPAGFDELPADAPGFTFTVIEQSLSRPEPRLRHENGQSVLASAPDGSLYEAYTGHDDPQTITPGHGFVSTLDNRRQRYGTHHGSAYHPEDVFIGKREAGRLKPLLFFRDIGSHTTAPHHLAIDSEGRCHLTVADVNIYQGNRLDLYWVIGEPSTGKWVSAWLLERRGFTSSAHPWSASWEDKIHLLWSWYTGVEDSLATDSGIFHVEWSPRGFNRKVRVVPGDVDVWDAAVPTESGRLLIAFSTDEGLFAISRTQNGEWTQPERVHPKGPSALSVEPAQNGDFVIRTGLSQLESLLTDSETGQEFRLRPQ